MEPQIVTTPLPGEKVIRGRDWDYGDQDRNSTYGIVVETLGSGANLTADQGWCYVQWVHEDNPDVVLQTNGYRVGNQGKYDLYYYKPEGKPVTYTKTEAKQEWARMITESTRSHKYLNAERGEKFAAMISYLSEMYEIPKLKP